MIQPLRQPMGRSPTSTRAIWDRLMSVAGCGCAGGFIASTVAHYVGAPDWTATAGAALFAAGAAWIEFGVRRWSATQPYLDRAR